MKPADERRAAARDSAASPPSLVPCVPLNGTQLAAARAALKVLLGELLHVAVAFEPEPHSPARPSPAWGRIAVPTESHLRFDADGWAQLCIRLELAPRAPARAACKLDVAVSLLPLEIPLLARVAQTPDRRLLAVEWRLPEPCHPLLRPDRASGAVTSAPTYEFLTLQIPAHRQASVVAEAAPAPACPPAPPRPALPPGLPAPPPPKPERSLTISAAWVPSRSRRLPPRPPGHYVPALRIAAQWLAGAGFDIGQRVRVRAERGRLVLIPGVAAGRSARPETPGRAGKAK
jgi:Toxin SymE, type I toxin-antitoxin system